MYLRLVKGSNFTLFAGTFDMLNAIFSRKNVNEKRLNRELRVGVSNFFNSFDLETEKKFMKVMVKLYDQNVGDRLTAIENYSKRFSSEEQ